MERVWVGQEGGEEGGRGTGGGGRGGGRGTGTRVITCNSSALFIACVAAGIWFCCTEGRVKTTVEPLYHY